SGCPPPARKRYGRQAPESAPPHPNCRGAIRLTPPPHTPHLRRRENRVLGRRFWFAIAPPRTGTNSPCLSFTSCQRSSGTMRRSGRPLTIQSFSGFSRETRFPVAGSF